MFSRVNVFCQDYVPDMSFADNRKTRAGCGAVSGLTAVRHICTCILVNQSGGHAKVDVNSIAPPQRSRVSSSTISGDLNNRERPLHRLPQEI